MKKQDLIKDSKRIVIKVGSALLIDKDTGRLKKNGLNLLHLTLKILLNQEKKFY